MFMMTAKVDFKKILVILAVIAGIILALVLLLGGDSQPASATAVSGNDARVQFLKDKGWEVSNSPQESGQVRIPREANSVYERYNALQKSQGYDLTPYAGKTVMRYVYKVNNYPGATDPVYATLLVHKNQVIGGDITDTSAKGSVAALQKSAETPTEATAPSTTAPTGE